MFLTKFPITQEGFIEVPITAGMVRVAEESAKRLGKRKGSIRNGEGNAAGYLGQLAILSAIYGITDCDTYDSDVACGDELTIEVKSKDRTKYPKMHYECSVAAMNSTQKADLYMFTSILRKDNQYTTAHILGYMPCNKYLIESKFLKKGTLDPSNGWVVSADCFNMPIEKLTRFDESIQFLDAGLPGRRKKRQILLKSKIGIDTNITEVNKHLNVY